MPLFCCASVAFAQFYGLATDFSGDRVFFITPLRQTGTEQVTHGKLFVLDMAAGLKLLYQSEWKNPPTIGPNLGLHTVYAAADGSMVALNGSYSCFGGSSCTWRQLDWGVTLNVGTHEVSASMPSAALSRNARFAGSRSGNGMPGYAVPEMSVRDLSTGEVRGWGSGNVVAVSSMGDAVQLDGRCWTALPVSSVGTAKLSNLTS